MGNQGREDLWQGGSWQTGRSHIRLRINCKKQLESKADHATQGSSAGKQSPKTYGYKNLWGLWKREKLPVLQETSVEGPMNIHWKLLEPTQTHPPRNLH